MDLQLRLGEALGTRLPNTTSSRYLTSNIWSAYITERKFGDPLPQLEGYVCPATNRRPPGRPTHHRSCLNMAAYTFSSFPSQILSTESRILSNLQSYRVGIKYLKVNWKMHNSVVSRR